MPRLRRTKMSDLPKRGDRVRVTEVLSGSFLRFSEEITLIEDARPCPNWGEGACVCIYEGRNGNGFGRTWSGPVKVEILERAASADEPKTDVDRVWFITEGADEDTKPREPGCQCQWEEGDSPCPVHGEHEIHPTHVTPGSGDAPACPACGATTPPETSESCPGEKPSTKAIREVRESIERLATTSVYQAKQDAAAEFARGMRRAVEIALEVTRQFGRNDIGRALKEATEQELKDGW